MIWLTHTVWEFYFFQGFIGVMTAGWNTYSNTMISEVVPAPKMYLFFSLFFIVGVSEYMQALCFLDLSLPRHADDAENLVLRRSLYCFCHYRQSRRQHVSVILVDILFGCGGSDTLAFGGRQESQSGLCRV